MTSFVFCVLDMSVRVDAILVCHVIDHVVAAVDAQDIQDVKVMTNIVSLRCRVRCVRHFTQDIVASVGNIVGVQLCTSHNIIDASPCCSMTSTDLSSIMIHEHELESKLIFGWTTGK
jgi:hypothetical protein